MKRSSIAICMFCCCLVLGASTQLDAAPMQKPATPTDSKPQQTDADAGPKKGQSKTKKPKAKQKRKGQSDHSPTRTETFKTIGDVELKLHIFEPEGHKATDQKPVAVFFFGGGWSSGSPKQFYAHCDYLADRGIVSIAADYRVSSRHKTTPAECVKDGKSAIRWIRDHATELGVDPNQLIAGGGSAGGHVAAATGTATTFDDEPDSETDCRPQALVLFNPVFDNGPKGFGHARVKKYWRKISPMHNIDAQTPPTIVFFGTKDKFVPVATAEKYKQQMQQLKLRCDLFLYDNKQHGFFNYKNGRNEKQNKMFNETMLETDSFLSSLGYLKAKTKPVLEE